MKPPKLGKLLAEKLWLGCTRDATKPRVPAGGPPIGVFVRGDRHCVLEGGHGDATAGKPPPLPRQTMVDLTKRMTFCL